MQKKTLVDSAKERDTVEVKVHSVDLSNIPREKAVVIMNSWFGPTMRAACYLN